jgi:hypothetical protein
MGEIAIGDGASWRRRSLYILGAFLGLACVVFAVGRMAQHAASRKLAEWRDARSRLPGRSCGICGQMARFDVTRLKRVPGHGVTRVHIGLRCEAHRESESLAVESGLHSACLLEIMAGLLLLVGLGASVRPLALNLPHPFWPQPRLRPARKASLVLACTIWVTVTLYILVVSFNESYLTVPLWLTLGGMLCIWLHDLLSGGAYLRCIECDWQGNLKDVQHFAGMCGHCDSRLFRVQELLTAQRRGTRTTYHYRMMVGLTLEQLLELDREGRIWKDPRGHWRRASTKVEAPEWKPATPATALAAP